LRTGAHYVERGSYALFWSATEILAGDAWYRQFYSGADSVSRGNSKTLGISVRCLMN
jgi:uncharacterized protein (TIGR02145 family)